jgi:asparagine synthase (glutamine-hydrolysing)
MCGIAGILKLDGGTPETSTIRAMCDAMVHRGPDAGGYCTEQGIALGHRRLSIIDLSDAANQPFTDASGRYTLVFNGELYNYREVRSMLPDYPFRTSSDTEVLVAAFARWGQSCIERFKGMFAFAVWDRMDRVLHICRDRLGVKPLYYVHQGGQLLFASEIRSILASGLIPRRLDPSAIADYLSFQSFGFPTSPICGILQLEAGSWMRVSAHGIETRRYWSVTDQPEFDVNMSDPAAVRQEIRRLLRTAVEQRMVSDVPVGAFLSGGIDSSVVVGLMAEVSQDRPSTFNVSFTEKDYDESAFAIRVSERFNTRHTTIRLTPEDYLDQLEPALDAMDIPSGDGTNTYVVSKAIRDAGIRVALSGIGGDELFAGYPFFHKYLSLRKYQQVFAQTGPLRRFAAGMLDLTGTSRYHRMAALLRARDVSIASTYPEFRRILSEQMIGRLTHRDPTADGRFQRLLSLLSPELDRLPLLSQVTAAELMGYTQQTLLKDTDQMSMAHALEVREPFFDHELVSFMLQVPDSVKQPIYPKSLLVESVAPLLPDEIVHRKKQGFLFPFPLWMRGALREFCDRRIRSLSDRDFIQGKPLQAYWQRFLRGDQNISWSELWQFVVLEHWMEKNGVE